MPVILDPVTSPTAQDRADLLKTLADWPDTLPPLPAAGEDATAWLERLLADPRQRLLAGRFNGRIIALAWLEQGAAGTIWLRAVCVRKLTRGRGVGERMLTLLGEQLDREQQALACELPVPLPTRAWMGQYGFRSGEHANVLVRPPRT